MYLELVKSKNKTFMYVKIPKTNKFISKIIHKFDFVEDQQDLKPVPITFYKNKIKEYNKEEYSLVQMLRFLVILVLN